MGGTHKAIFYSKCCRMSKKDEKRYKSMYNKTSLDFWIREYKYHFFLAIHKTETVKIILGTRVPLEIYFKIMGYLNLNNLVE